MNVILFQYQRIHLLICHIPAPIIAIVQMFVEVVVQVIQTGCSWEQGNYHSSKCRIELQLSWKLLFPPLVSDKCLALSSLGGLLLKLFVDALAL